MEALPRILMDVGSKMRDHQTTPRLRRRRLVKLNSVYFIDRRFLYLSSYHTPGFRHQLERDPTHFGAQVAVVHAQHLAQWQELVPNDSRLINRHYAAKSFVYGVNYWED